MGALGFPFTIDASGRVLYTEDEAAEARAEVINCLMTSLGERVMRPGYGGGVRDDMFEPMDDSLISELTTRAQDALTAEVPSINVSQIDARANPHNDGVLDLFVYFTLKKELDGGTRMAVASITTDGIVTEEVL